MLTEINGYKAHVCDRCRKIVYPSRTAKKIERSIERENAKIQKSDPEIPDLSLCL